MSVAFSRLNRIAWTVRYLKARQIGGQIRHRVSNSFGRGVHANSLTAAEYPGCAWADGVRFLAPGAQDRAADAIRQGTLRFLNSEVTAGFPPGWDGPGLSKLWQYNLHYFEWLWALTYKDGWMAGPSSLAPIVLRFGWSARVL
jgi:hypothetical protein